MTNDHASDQNPTGNPTQKDPDAVPEGIDESTAASLAPPSRERRWMKILGAVVVLLLLLLLLAPTILSTSVVRSFVVGKINEKLNGRVDIADWKVSWTSGVIVTGVRVFDDKNSQIAQVESIATQLSLLKAIGGDLKLGETVIRGPDFTLIQDPDGSINFAKLVKPSDKPDEPASDLPKLSGNIRIENGRGMFVRNSGDPKTSQKVKMTDIAATVAIADINQPIDHSVSVTASVNDGAAGTVSVKGKAGVITASRVNIDAANLDETVELKNLDTGAIKAFLPPDVVRQLAGVLNGTIGAKVAGGKSAEIRGQIDGKQIAFATGKFAPGEAYATDDLSITLPVTISLPKGLTDFDSAVVRTDGAISLRTGQVQLSLAVDAPLASLLSAAKNQAVATPGKLHQTLVVNLPPLLAMLPKTLGLRDGAVLTSGTLEQSVTADLSPGQSQIAVAVDIKEVDGTAPIANAQGQATPQRFTVEPVSLKFNTTSRGGGFATPDLRDLKLDLASGFASGSFAAPTLASLKGNIDADLAKLKQQLGQFLSLDDVPLAGKVTIAASNSGDPTRMTEPATFAVTVTGTDINTAFGGKTIKQSLVRVGITGTVHRTETGDVKEVRDLRLTTRVGAESSPTVDVQIAAAITYVPPAAGSAGGAPGRYDIPAFTIEKANITLKHAQADFGAFIPAMKDYDFSGGVASITGNGAMVNGVVRFTGNVATTDVNLGRHLSLSATGPAARVRSRSDVLLGYTLTANFGATYQPQPEGSALLTVENLKIADNRKLLTIDQKSPLTVTMPKTGSPQTSGKLDLEIDLVQIHDLIRKLTATGRDVIAEASSPDKPILVRKGWLAATIDVAQLADGAMTLSLQGGVDALTLAGNKPVVTDEKITLSVKASTGPKLATAVLEQLQLKSGLANFDASGQFVLNKVVGDTIEPVPPMEMVRRLSVTATASDVAKLQSVADAWQHSHGAAVDAMSPYQYGPLTFECESTARVTGKNAYPPRLPVTLAAADGKLPPGTPIPATLPAAAPSIMEQIGEIRVTELSASGVGMLIGAKEHIVIRDPADLMALFAPPTPKSPATAAAKPASAVATGVPATQPVAPPAKLAGGAATISLEITGDGRTLSIVPDVSATKLAATVGAATRDLGDISLKSKLSIASRAADAPAAAPSLAGTVTVAGQIEPLMELSAFLGGKPAKSPYAGALNFEQKFTTQGAVIKLQGTGAIADFVSRDAAGKQTFAEKSIRIDDDLSFDTAGVGALSLTKLGVAFESSAALNVNLTGRIIDLSRSRVFDNVVADVTYDAEKLWPIVRGMMADPATPADKDPYKDYVVKGKANRKFVLGGSFPAIDDKGNAVPTTAALRSLIARGGVALDLVEAEGLTIVMLDIPITLVDGVMTLIDDAKPQGQQRPAPIACNSGTIDVGGIAIDLTGEFPTLSIPPNQALLSKVQLNPALAKSLGDLVNNPLFVPSAETRGIMDVLIVECRDVPLGKQLKVHGPSNKGYAVATFSFSGAQLKNDMIVGIMGFLNADADSLLGSIRDGKVEYKSGFIGHDMTFVLGERQERTLWLYGSVRLADNQMLPLTMFISPQWFSREIARYAPKGVPLALSGSFRTPQYNFQAAVQETIKQNYFSGKPEDIGNLIDLFSGKKKDPVPAPKPGPGAGTNPPATTKPATPPKDNPLGILGDLLGQAAKDRERKEQEKKEQERREKEKRDAKKKQN